MQAVRDAKKDAELCLVDDCGKPAKAYTYVVEEPAERAGEKLTLYWCDEHWAEMNEEDKPM